MDQLVQGSNVARRKIAHEKRDGFGHGRRRGVVILNKRKLRHHQLGCRKQRFRYLLLRRRHGDRPGNRLVHGRGPSLHRVEVAKNAVHAFPL